MTDMLNKNKGKWVNRLLIGTPTTGLVRMEWVNGRYGATIPTNWSHVDVQQFLRPYLPIAYQVADAENLIAKTLVENDFEWLLFWEHDNIPKSDALIRLNEYMIKGEVPVVAGLYFTKSVPPEPMIYREYGKGFFADWKLGDKVWCKGVPFGFTLIHGNIIRELWKISPEYNCGGTITRRVFHAPADSWTDPESGGFLNNYGTSDLAFCKQLVEGDVFAKAGFPAYQKKQYPFLVDTKILVNHIDNNGVVYPINLPVDFREGRKTFKQVMMTE